MCTPERLVGIEPWSLAPHAYNDFVSTTGFRDGLISDGYARSLLQDVAFDTSSAHTQESLMPDFEPSTFSKTNNYPATEVVLHGLRRSSSDSEFPFVTLAPHQPAAAAAHKGFGRGTEWPVLVLLRGHQRADLSQLARELGVGRHRVRMASRHECVAVFGYPPGSMPPMGLRQLDTLTIADSLVADHGGCASQPQVRSWWRRVGRGGWRTLRCGVMIERTIQYSPLLMLPKTRVLVIKKSLHRVWCVDGLGALGDVCP